MIVVYGRSVDGLHIFLSSIWIIIMYYLIIEMYSNFHIKLFK